MERKEYTIADMGMDSRFRLSKFSSSRTVVIYKLQSMDTVKVIDVDKMWVESTAQTISRPSRKLVSLQTSVYPVVDEDYIEKPGKKLLVTVQECDKDFVGKLIAGRDKHQNIVKQLDNLIRLYTT